MQFSHGFHDLLVCTSFPIRFARLSQVLLPFPPRSLAIWQSSSGGLCVPVSFTGVDPYILLAAQVVHDHWFQISSSISAVEGLFEDEDFSHRQLAALLASKVSIVVFGTESTVR